MTNVLFIHNKKCGGMTITKELEKKYNVTRLNKILKITLKHCLNNKKYIVGNIRDPYKYYVSAFRWGPSARGKTKFTCEEHKKEEGILKNNNNWNNIIKFRVWMKYVLLCKDVLINYSGCNLTEIMKKHNIGLLTCRFL